MTGTRPFPVQLVNYSSIGSGYGYGMIVITDEARRFVYATSEQCTTPLTSSPSLATGSFCGASYVAGESSSSNATFATVSISSASIPGTSPEVITYLTTVYASRRVSPSPPLNISFLGLPWLLPFFTPVALRFVSASSMYILNAGDVLGWYAISLDNTSCGAPLPAGTRLCGPPVSGKSQTPVEAGVSVLSATNPTKPGGSMVLELQLFQAWKQSTFSATAFVINSNVLYYAGSVLPPLMIGNSTNSSGTYVQVEGTAYASPPGALLSMTSCSQVRVYYCGATSCGTASSTSMLSVDS